MWDNWSIRFAVHPRFGLMLYEIDYFDNNAGQSDSFVQRRIVYKANLSEGITAYGNPAFPTKNHNFFDFAGEYNAKFFMSPFDAPVLTFLVMRHF